MERPSYNLKTGEGKLFNELRKRVKERVNSIPENRDHYIRVKVFLLPLIYFGSYFIAIFNGSNPWLYTGMFVIMGLTLVLIYLNLIHEAAHNNIFKQAKYDKWVLFIFDLIGANSYMWQKRHIESHHSYPNVDGWDTDVEQSGPILIMPHYEPNGIQKYQHRYIFFIYPLYLFNWLLIRDFRDFFSKDRVIYKVHGAMPLKQKIRMVIFKLFYLFYQIGIPVLFLKVSFGLALGAWALQILVASVFALFVLLPLHPLPDNMFPLPDKDNVLPYSWLRHQLEVTNDLSHNNWFIRNVLGNFNFHVAHHLFPTYSYLYYNEITDEIESFAKEHGMNYKRIPLFTALKKHWTLLKMNAEKGTLHHVFEGLDS